MRGIRNIFFSGLLALACSCTSIQKEEIIFQPSCVRKELVSTPQEVIVNAKKYSLPVYVLKKENQTCGYFTEGITSEERDKIGKVVFAYQCSDNFGIIDDYFFSYNKPLRQGYRIEGYVK